MGFALLINSTVVLVDPTIMPYQTACLLRQVFLSRPHSRLASCIFPLQRLTTLLLPSSSSFLSRSLLASQSKAKTQGNAAVDTSFQLALDATHTRTHTQSQRQAQPRTTNNNQQVTFPTNRFFTRCPEDANVLCCLVVWIFKIFI